MPDTTVSVRLSHLDLKATPGQLRHDLRRGLVPAYVDRDRSHGNSILIKPQSGKALADLCQARRAQLPHRRAMKSNAAVATVGIITFSHAAQPIILSLPEDEQNRLYREVAERIAHACRNTVSGLVVHRDESAPHAHFQMPAYNLDGLPMSKVVKIDMARRLQDLAGEVYAAHGISRGKPKTQRIADGEPVSAWVHRSVRQLHNDLPAEIAAAQAALEAARDKLRKNEELVRKAQDKLEARQGDLEKTERNLQAYQRRAQAAQQAIAEQEARLQKLRNVESDLAKDAPPLPKIAAQNYEVVSRKGVLGLLPQTETLALVPAADVRALIQSVKAREKALREKAAREVQAAREAAEQRARELDARQCALQAREEDVHKAETTWQRHGAGLQQILTALEQRPCAQSSRTAIWPDFVRRQPLQAAAQVLDGQTQVRYSVLVQAWADRVLLPPQQATAAQKAAALYRVARETAQQQGWPGITFTVHDPELARHLEAMRQQDGLRATILLKGQPYAPDRDGSDARHPVRATSQPSDGPDPHGPMPL